MRYVAFLHTDGAGGFGISFPDFPGAIPDEDTVDAAILRGEDALAFHVQGMRGDRLAVPGLAEWRAGAQIAHVALILDRGTDTHSNDSCTCAAGAGTNRSGWR